MTEKNLPPRWAFIVNPVAGNGKSLVVEQELLRQLHQRSLSAKIVRTQHKGHAYHLAGELVQQGFTHIIAVGGDGTLNEMASALVDHPHCTAGLIPAGTGNDFARIPGLPEHFEEPDWEMFFEAHTHFLDVGRCNGNWFFNGMGLGFDAQVAAENYEAPGKVKRGGKSKYIWHILKNLLFYKEQMMKIHTDEGEREQVCFLNTISIGRRYAGGFYLTPKAYADDGLLDICMVEKINLFQRLAILLKVPKGEHLAHPKVHYFQARKIVIDLDHTSVYHLDGELFEDRHLEIEVFPAKIRFIYPPHGDHYLLHTKPEK